MRTGDPLSSLSPLTLVDAIVESVIITDTELEIPGPTIVHANPAFERMTGWSRNEIVGRSPRVLQGPKTDTGVFSDLRSRLRGDGYWEGRAINYRKDGSDFVMEWSIASVRDEQGPVSHYIAVQRDVTARLKTEAELRATREAVIESLRRREQMREIFGKFVPDAIVDHVLADSGALVPDQRVGTVFYSDITGFSTLTENMEPKAVIDLLNEYFSLMISSIELYGGVVHQFQGDAILATFNIPLTDPMHASNAVSAALEIRESLHRHRFPGGLQIATRIGINTGTVVAGTVGGPGRLGYTVHGDTVNLTARIEQENKRFGTDILLGESTAAMCGTQFSLRTVQTMCVRGRQQPVTLYSIA